MNDKIFKNMFNKIYKYIIFFFIFTIKNMKNE